MTTRIQANGPHTTVALTQTSTRVTPSPAQPFKNVLQGGANVVMQGANAAVQRLPGGPVLAAAVRTPPEGVSATDPMSGSAATGSMSADGVSAGASPDYGGDMSNVLQQQSENSMHYLQLQQQIQEETRAFTTISNVLKARHDTVKNAINNVR